MIHERNLFDQPVKIDLKTNDNIRKITTGQGDDYRTVLLDYHYFKKYYKIIIDLSKQKPLDADPNTIHQINFTRNLDGNTTFFIYEEVKEIFQIFHKKPCEYFKFILLKYHINII